MSTTIMRNRNVSINTVPKPPKKRSIFPAHWSRKQTMLASYITPIMRKRILPGDTWSIDLANFSRLATQVTCPIDNLIVETFFFYCPDRLVWSNAPYFYGAIKDPNAETQPEYTIPMLTCTAAQNTAGSLFNYLTNARLGKKLKVSALPFRMHNLIQNTYFRDPDCESPYPVPMGDSGDNLTDYLLYRIHKSRDYFTQSTRDIMKDGDVTIPIGTIAPVIQPALTVLDNRKSLKLWNTTGQNPTGTSGNLCWTTADQESAGQAWLYGDTNSEITGTEGANTKFKVNLATDLRNATGAQLSALRQAIMTAEYREALNRGGTNYRDIMQNIYDVTIPDLTIQRPEYLGGTSAPMFTNPVIQQSATGSSGTPQGNIAGYGTFGESGKVIQASFQEFGYILGYMVVKSVPQYQQGVDRDLTAEDKYEIFNPFYVNASDQAIRMDEIFAEDYDAVDASGNVKNEKVFGYTPMYEHYRRFNNEIAGELNSEYQYSMDSWTYAEKFENAPANNYTFMKDKTHNILKRSMAVRYEDENETVEAPQIIADIHFDGYVARPLPTYGTPKISALI